MKKTAFLLCSICLFSLASHSQIMVAKMIGKDVSKYGLGYGLFTYLDIPLKNENQSFRVELIDIALFPTKGENLFTSTADMKGYISIKLGYKYVFSETQQGFYLLPSAGYCRVTYVPEGEDATSADGWAGALEGGYTLEVGKNGHTLNLGLKYEYDHGNSTHIIQAIGLRFSYAFGLFRKK